MQSDEPLLLDAPNDMAGSAKVKSEPKCIPGNTAMPITAHGLARILERKLQNVVPC